jgi:hypothetical protein
MRLDTYGDYDNGATAGTVFAIYAVVFGITLVIAAAAYVVTAIALSALFRKTGVEGWKAWVPFYNTFTWLQLGGQSGHWMWLSFVPYGSVVTAIFLYISMYRTGIAFRKESGFLVLGIFLPIVWLFILGYGKDVYEPGRIAAAGLSGPYVGYGAVPPGTPAQRNAQQQYAQQQYGQPQPQPGQPAYGQQPYPTQPPAYAPPVPGGSPYDAAPTEPTEPPAGPPAPAAPPAAPTA